ncbi:MAG: enoyl-CoA hydratase-related protein, partial [Casimicrobiaceae bacterium]
LLCACDLAVAADDAYFTTAYRHIALTPDGGGTWALPRIVGMRKAMEMLLLSERLDAREALRIGLVNRVVPAAELEAQVATLAQSLVNGPRMAIVNAKRLARESLDRSLAQQLQAEAASFADCTATPDFVEGIRAFLEKRPAKFAP